MALATDEVGSSQTTTTSVDFPRFDVVAYEPSDHFYFKKTKGSTSGTKAKTATVDVAVIMREWEILERDLPDSIFVRAYETRISLLRAAIVGPQHTPYHNFLFFFDIYLPPRYPSKPPKVFYRSFGAKGINPAFHEHRVSFNILNNIYLPKCSERSALKSSIILQVLLSIQGTLLAEKSYYHNIGGQLPPGQSIEEGWRAHIKLFELCCLATINMLKDPPRYFEALVIPHFCKRGSEILYLWYVYHTEGKRSPIHVGVFRRMNLEVLHWNIASALAKSGAPVNNLVKRKLNELKWRKLMAEARKDRRKDSFNDWHWMIRLMIKCGGLSIILNT